METPFAFGGIISTIPVGVGIGMASPERSVGFTLRTDNKAIDVLGPLSSQRVMAVGVTASAIGCEPERPTPPDT